MNDSPGILFLCTANYYRSRFAELYFNHLADLEGLAVRADSAGLEMAKWRSYNPGDLSVHTVTALAELGVALDEPYRAPRQFDPDRSRGQRLIALSQSEHRPMVQRLFPDVLDQVEFWGVEDVEFEHPETAVKLMKESIERCIEDYK
ncbi:low molecular weight phosphatase family protein [Coraliomargarita sinensis]|uniref:Low molecular weight phosphatase family protein n=2 Tax=Coraliomargarita sinensis TaxID=2174842 RepID=A0A317ZMW9_9BACT|nr:low molecular weight phosphatase family protein [Coraliomargarita sinensis]